MAFLSLKIHEFKEPRHPVAIRTKVEAEAMQLFESLGGQSVKLISLLRDPFGETGIARPFRRHASVTEARAERCEFLHPLVPLTGCQIVLHGFILCWLAEAAQCRTGRRTR